MMVRASGPGTGHPRVAAVRLLAVRPRCLLRSIARRHAEWWPPTEPKESSDGQLRVLDHQVLEGYVRIDGPMHDRARRSWSS
jgi:hypothetical protein